jgi:quercetin dioxygenase-like cupin family protein
MDEAPTTDRAVHLRRADLRVRWDLLPGGTDFGTIRGAYNGIEATNCMANLIVVPFGQHSPVHTFDGEHVVHHVAGRVEWDTQVGTYVLEPGDLFFLAADVEYAYTNIGSDDAYFLDVAARAEAWPPTIHYKDGSTVEHDSYGSLFDE